ncbi:MAG: hypothetical protein GKR89_14400 [Candidatus Latescibacteria bacterium]|nr:hypothetical protein [Candidatus Latescibacterota bacterium]
MEKIERRTVERAARLYKSNSEAAAALGVAMRSFGRMCKAYGIETPWGRKRRRQQGAAASR